MENFWDYSVWGFFNLFATLLLSLLAANMMKKNIPALQASLIPTSVLGGGILLVIAGFYKMATGVPFFDTPFFGGDGSDLLEMLTYHPLALGFIASALKTSENKMTKQRTVEIFNTGVTTVSTYLLQAVLGFGITLLAAATVMPDLFPASGVLLPFGYGQGTGQALNYGGIYQNEYGFVGGKSFGLTVAALGFLSASLGGVIHLVLLRRRGLIAAAHAEEGKLQSEEIQSDSEIPMQESIDKLTVQVALIAAAYMLAYLMMDQLGKLLPGMRSVIFGFNFLLGVLSATLIKLLFQLLRRTGWMKKEYTNNFLLTRACNFFFDIMVVAGIAAIRLEALQRYWAILLVLGLAGALATYWYLRLVCKVLFPAYEQEQFLTMYGMLTGTASTGVILLRELDGEFKTPAADNMVYQNFPAIVFGFPMMLLATLAPQQPGLTMVLLVVFLLAMLALLFRSVWLAKLRGKTKTGSAE